MKRLILTISLIPVIFGAAGATGAHPANIQQRENGRSELMEQAMFGRLPQVKALIEKGVDLNATDNAGMTALMWAALGGNIEIVQLLLATGAKIDVIDNKGHTAYYYAATAGNSSIAALLKPPAPVVKTDTNHAGGAQADPNASVHTQHMDMDDLADAGDPFIQQFLAAAQRAVEREKQGAKITDDDAAQIAESVIPDPRYVKKDATSRGSGENSKGVVSPFTTAMLFAYPPVGLLSLFFDISKSSSDKSGTPKKSTRSTTASAPSTTSRTNSNITLDRRAYGISHQRPNGKPGWTVFFCFKSADTVYPQGRAISMNDFGGEINYEEGLFELDKVEKRLGAN